MTEKSLCKPSKQNLWWKKFKSQYQLHLMSLPGLVLLIVFSYIPMYGLIIAFQDYNPGLGYFGSPFVGLKHFIRFFNDPYLSRIVRNSLILGFYGITICFAAPILFALLLNELKGKIFKRTVQTISYMPYFLSIVVVVGMMRDLCMMDGGAINTLVAALGFEKIQFFGRPEWFRTLYIVSGIWQGIGFSSIIYLAAISGIDPGLYEAATIDGAKRFKQAIHITLPCIVPTIIILFILGIGGIIGGDFQKIILMYSPKIFETSDVISTYIYRMGIENASFSYSTAVGFIQNIFTFILIIITNAVSRKVSETSLW